MKKVAIYAYYFPPQISAGSQRPARMANMLAQLGYLVDVYTNNPLPEEQDVTQFHESHHSVNIIKINDSFISFACYLPNFILKILNFISIPDSKIFHVFKASREIRKNKYDLLITTSAPLSAHLLGAYLIRNVRWVADVRDSIIRNPSYYQKKFKPLEYQIGKIINPIINRKANIILTASKTISRDFSNQNTHTFYNGYFEEDMWPKLPISEDKFTIGYIGSLYAERNPEIFIDGFLNFIEQLSDHERSFISLSFIGSSPESYRKKLLPFSEKVEVKVLPYMRKGELFKLASTWSVLLLLVDEVPFAEGVITGKLFDYLCLNGQILAIAPLNSEIRDIVESTKRGRVFSREESENVSAFLHEIFHNWRHRKFDQFKSIKDEIRKFSYKNQMVQLDKILNQHLD